MLFIRFKAGSLFVISVIQYFCFEGKILVLNVQVPVHCLLSILTYYAIKNSVKCNMYANSMVARQLKMNCKLPLP